MTFDTTMEIDAPATEDVPLCGGRRNQLVNGITGAITDASDNTVRASRLLREALLTDPTLLIDVAMALYDTSRSNAQGGDRLKTLNVTIGVACRKLDIHPPYRVAKPHVLRRSQPPASRYRLERRAIISESPEYHAALRVRYVTRKFIGTPEGAEYLISLGWTPPNNGASN